MARGASPTVRRLELASELRRLRHEAGKTLEDAAGALECSAATISRIENGHRIPQARDVRDLCALYEVTDESQIQRLTGYVQGAQESGWWEAYSEVGEEYSTYIGLEASATEMQQFDGMRIPGLLQTADYMRAYYRGAAEQTRGQPAYSDRGIERRIEIRLRRQEVLQGPAPLRLTVVIDEAALRRPVGSPDVFQAQMSHLLDVAQLPSVDLRLLMFEAGQHPGMEGQFTIIRLPQEELADVVYVEGLVGTLFLDSHKDLLRYTRVFESLTRAALDPARSQDTLARLATAN